MLPRLAPRFLSVPLLALVAMVAMADGSAAFAADIAVGDPLAAWRAIPVLDDGRIMPLDSFARRRVETITNAQRPSLASPGSEEPRRWNADELLLEWLVRPEAWEDVPLLIAEHEELRGLLDLPVFAE
jgi:hypothetical protein